MRGVIKNENKFKIFTIATNSNSCPMLDTKKETNFVTKIERRKLFFSSVVNAFDESTNKQCETKMGK